MVQLTSQAFAGLQGSGFRRRPGSRACNTASENLICKPVLAVFALFLKKVCKTRESQLAL